ncbi:MAG: DUF1641 domain-containing protein [Nitrospirae bacterium]|nr:DUF1641 domain-containing protein [Nitrospirota bacterium]
MAKKNTDVSSGGIEVVAAQVNDIHSRLKIIEGLVTDMVPAMEKITREIGETINDLRYRYERDETLELIKKVGDNIPTFIQMLDAMKAFKGFFEDIMPAVGTIIKEVTPAINSLRLLFERDETLELLLKTGENVPVFNKLLDFLNSFEKSGDLDFTLKTAFAKETEFMIKGMEKCAVRTMQQLMEKPLKPGMLSLFTAIKDPEVQKGFVLMTTFAKNMPQCMLETIESSGEVFKPKTR